MELELVEDSEFVSENKTTWKRKREKKSKKETLVWLKMMNSI
jgi:hypothetical protein